MTGSEGPLHGLRVIDLTRMLAGPYCTMLLADLGADVVKVEPLDGDGTRTTGPFAEDDGLRAYGGYFQSVNRNKRGIALDLKQEPGRAVLMRLAEGADVLVENFRTGVMDRLGLGYETLAQANPRLVYAAVRGFGDPRTGESPYRDWPAFDVTAQAFGGFMGITGPAPGQPQKAGPGIGDLFPATLAALGVVAAVHHAQSSGRGQFVDVAMYDGVLALCERIVYQYSYGGAVPTQQGNGHPLFCPFDVFATSDGFVTIAAPEDGQWAFLVEAMGRPDLGDDRYATKEARIMRQDDVRGAVSGWAGARTTAEVLRALGGRVPVGPVQTVADIFADPHVRARDMLVEVEQPGSGSRRAIAGSPIKLTLTPTAVRRRAPLLGEHTDEVLAEAGYSEAERRRLRESGTVG
jgi:crotonobetainyl-CoA:carnitine CoA-transferase CaiB-like acyl-CoA transferase